eukprot:1344311-Amorphochlora_amoeboformis.AAC.1
MATDLIKRLFRNQNESGAIPMGNIRSLVIQRAETLVKMNALDTRDSSSSDGDLDLDSTSLGTPIRCCSGILTLVTSLSRVKYRSA